MLIYAEKLKSQKAKKLRRWKAKKQKTPKQKNLKGESWEDNLRDQDVKMFTETHWKVDN